ncbi:MAG: UbiD family decarboxylase [Dehalococcoidia bacterium]|nr:UbiD family decarboxylase [Dehalococcoidia bacterium]
MPKDLRNYLAGYEKAHPDQVIHVEKEIGCAQEVTTLAMKLEAKEKYPNLVLHNVIRADGRKSPFPLVTNLLASRSRCAQAMNSTYERVGIDYYRQARQDKRPPVVISRSEAPVKQVVMKGTDIDLYQFPALIHHYMDPGPYFTAGFMTTYDPESGIDNSALHRGWMVEKDKVRCYLTPFSHARFSFDKHEAAGTDMRVAYWVGHHPVACLAAQTRLGYPESHYEAMGGLLGEPLRVVASETLGDDFLMPADAEVIVEGILKTEGRYPEGPFGEYTGYIGPQIPNPQFQITAITHRRDAYWHDILVGHADNQVMGGFAIEGVVYEAVKARCPNLKAVYMPLSGTCRFHVYLQFEKPRPGEAREAILTALPLDYRIKHVFTFDSDINIFDERDVLLGVATRSQWDRDVIVCPDLRGSELDPTVNGALTTKGGIDCTKSQAGDFAERNKIDESIWQEVQIEDFISKDRLARIETERM